MSTMRPINLVSTLAEIVLIAVAFLWSEPLGAQAGSSIAGTGNESVVVRYGMVPQAIEVDARSGAATVSNTNGVLEPGESVVVEMNWWNDTEYAYGSSEGSLSSFTGPAGGIYSLQDASAAYGFEPIFGGGWCSDPYAVSVAGTRPATHWDSIVHEELSVGGRWSWTLHIGNSFSDVPVTHPFYKKIETILHKGVALGCTATQYCPNDPVARSEMAISLARGVALVDNVVAPSGGDSDIPASGIVGGQPYNCVAGGHSLYADVSPTDPSCRYVHYIASRNVTLGCGANAYCPENVVTRDVMASLIAKSVVAPAGGAGVPVSLDEQGRSYSCNPASPNLHFSDVPASNPFCKHIHFLWARAIVAGCSETQYCPGQTVSRGAMAKFIANAFGLELYGP